MSNWDDEDWDDSPAPAPSAVPKGHPLSNPADEAMGDWDDEDAESEPEPEVKKAPAPMKPSKARAKALKEKEEAEREAEIARVLKREAEMAEMSAIERKVRQQQIVEEADLDNARDLFGGSGEVQKKKNDDDLTIEEFKPETDADYAKLAKMVGKRCDALIVNPRRTERYVNFMKDVLRSATSQLGPEDTKDLSAFLGLLSNEKRDEQKKARGVKKKNNKKTSVRVDKASEMRQDNYDDFADDFM